MSRIRIIASLGLLFTLASGSALAQYQAGVHYQNLNNVVGTSVDGTVAVIEVFSYLCPHCNSFQPLVSNWDQNNSENVEFTRIPVIFQRSWEPFARAFYTARTMGIL